MTLQTTKFHLWSAAASVLLIYSGCQSRPSATVETMTLSHQGATPFVILISKDGQPYEKTAAQELSSFLGKNHPSGVSRRR